MAVGSSDIWYGIYGLISATFIVGNVAILSVYFRNRSLTNFSIKKPYNIFLVSLAITDFFTGVILIPSKYLILPPVPRSTTALAFCQTIWTSWLLFTCSHMSAMTCVMLAFERWLAIVKPLLFRRLTYQHALCMAFVAWFWTISWNFVVILQVQ